MIDAFKVGKSNKMVKKYNCTLYTSGFPHVTLGRMMTLLIYKCVSRQITRFACASIVTHCGNKQIISTRTGYRTIYNLEYSLAIEYKMVMNVGYNIFGEKCK